MEISALTRNAFAPAAPVERQPVAETSVAKEAARARQAARDATRQAERERAQGAQAARQATEQAAPPQAGSGRIEFEQDDGTRVMKVLDSKEVLIYQVPPKGQLSLIRAEEAAGKRDLALV